VAPRTSPDPPDESGPGPGPGQDPGRVEQAGSVGIHVEAGSRVDSITVQGDIAGRDVIKITEALTYDVSDLTRNPYVGLASYTYATAAFYGGREQQVQEAVERLTADGAEQVLLFVTGASGCGKSSFVQAGLLPALEEHYAQHGATVRHAIMRPGRLPLTALARALADLDGAEHATADITSPEVLNARLTSQTHRQQANVLVLDQFEELFTQSDSAERDTMCALLGGLGSFATVRTHLLVTLRVDFLPALFNIPALFDRAKRDGIELRAMQRAELAQAIQRPLRVEASREGKDRRLDPALVERLIDDVQADSTLLPLLQVTLRSLWEEPPHKLVLGRYQSLTHALEQHAESVYASDVQGRERSAADRAAIMDVFLALVEVSLDDDARRDVRRSVPKVDLLQLHPGRTGLIDELVEARLLTASAESRGDEHVEMIDVIHETLLTNWPRLRNEIAARREALQRSERFRIELQDWLENQQSTDYLLRGVHLAEARQLAERGDLGFRQPHARAFLAQSVTQEADEHQRELDQVRALAEEQRQRADVERQARRRQGRFSMVIAVLAVVAVLVAGVAVWQRGEATVQRDASNSRELASGAIVQLAVDPERSLVLATEAALTAGTLEAEDALRRALLGSHVRAVLTLPSAEAMTDAALSPDGTAVVLGGRDGALEVRQIGGPGVDLIGHTSAIAAVTFSPDGQRIASASYDNTARIWNRTRPADPPVVLRGHTDGVVVVAFSTDGQRVLTGSLDGTARVWDAATGVQQLELSGHAAGLTAARFDATGKQIVTASFDGTARVWNAGTGQAVAILRGHDDAVTDVAFSPDGTRLVSASVDKTARVWDLATPGQSTVLRGHTDALVSVAFSPDGKQILTASQDRTGRIWDATNLTAPPTVFSGHGGALAGGAFSPDGARVLTGSADRTARVWDAGTGKQLAVLRGHLGGVTVAKFSADGRQLLTVGDTTARIWEPSADQEVVALTGFRDAVSDVSFSPDGKRLLAASADGTAQVWDTDTWSVRARLTGQNGGIVRAGFSSASDTVLTASLDGTVGIWDPETGQELRLLGGPAAPVVDARFSPDGKRVLTASRDGTARLWDTRSGSLVRLLASLQTALTGVGFDPRGAWVVVTTADGSAHVWDVASGAELAVLAGHRGWLTGLAVDPRSGNVVTTSADGDARVWNPALGQVVRVLAGHTGMTTSASFSPDGTRVATTSVDGTARLWSLANGASMLLSGHNLPVWSTAFSPAGDRIVTAGDDGTARLWDAGTGQELVQLHGHTGPVRAAVFSPDGRYVATAGRDGIVQIHFSRLDAGLLSLAERRLPPSELAEVRSRFPSFGAGQ